MLIFLIRLSIPTYICSCIKLCNNYNVLIVLIILYSFTVYNAVLSILREK